MLNKNNERALVYLVNIDKLEPITFLNSEGNLEECSGIEKAVIQGWNVVVKKEVFEENQLAVFAEIDTILDKDIPLFAFLEGKRIRTKKLKGVVSQGVAFTIPEILSVIEDKYVAEEGQPSEKYLDFLASEWELGDDWTKLVGATKYDEYSNNGRKSDGVKLPPANARGNFPSFIHKTDEERIQNLAKELKYDWQGKEVVICEKLDGSSTSIYCKSNTYDGEQAWNIGICSRNLDLKLDSDNNHFIKTGLPYLDRLSEYCINNNRSLALQGEIIGPGIQGNPYKLDKHEIYFFNVFDIDAGRKLAHDDAQDIFMDLDVNDVPLINYQYSLNKTMEELLEKADGTSQLNSKTNREGIVVRALDGSFSFKVISNKWLLKEKD